MTWHTMTKTIVIFEETKNFAMHLVIIAFSFIHMDNGEASNCCNSQEGSKHICSYSNKLPQFLVFSYFSYILVDIF